MYFPLLWLAFDVFIDDEGDLSFYAKLLSFSLYFLCFDKLGLTWIEVGTCLMLDLGLTNEDLVFLYVCYDCYFGSIVIDPFFYFEIICGSKVQPFNWAFACSCLAQRIFSCLFYIHCWFRCKMSRVLKSWS